MFNSGGPDTMFAGCVSWTNTADVDTAALWSYFCSLLSISRAKMRSMTYTFLSNPRNENHWGCNVHILLSHVFSEQLQLQYDAIMCNFHWNLLEMLPFKVDNQNHQWECMEEPRVSVFFWMCARSRHQQLSCMCKEESVFVKCVYII